jgi:hypothetical protein
MTIETLIMILLRTNYTCGYSETRRCRFVGELITSWPTYYIKDKVIIPLERGDYANLFRGIIVELEYQDDGIYIVCGCDPADLVSMPISEKLLYNIATKWLAFRLSEKRYPYVRIDIDWDKNAINLQGLDSWDGPLDIVTYNPSTQQIS